MKLVLVAAALLFASINCGRIDNRQDVKLGIPYRSQDPGSFDCGPVSILLWRLYDGLSEIPQEQIGDVIGTTCGGSSPSAIADGVNIFTDTNDAFWDFAPRQDDPELFFARQISSIDRATPVIAIVNDGFHAGVVNGGKWSPCGSGLHRWDYVYFHDPQITYDVRHVADEWLDFNCLNLCSQIVSDNATNGFEFNYENFGGALKVRGTGDYPPPGPWPPEV